jgi:hypothetical protein
MDSELPTVHDEIAQGLKDHPARKGMLFNGIVTGIEVGGSIALFHLARSKGASDVVSYMVGSIGPLSAARTPRCCSTRIVRPPP